VGSDDWLMIARGDVELGVVADWNRWYDEIHLPAILGCPGFQRATRWVADSDGTSHFVTLYEVDRPSVMGTFEFAANRGLGPFVGRARVETHVFSRHLSLTRDSH
jgi:hypothetical protein